MFTGLIEAVGQVVEVAPSPDGLRLTVRAPVAEEVRPGDSVAVNGVCLTATDAAGGLLRADIGVETARITTLGTLRPGQPVNLERAVRADGRLGGHFVQGHVDGTAVVTGVRGEGDTRWIALRYPPDLARYIVLKGSIAVDGVSLTVAGLRGDLLELMIIPFTWAQTALSTLREGDRVNLECDMIGKYVARSMELFRAR